MDERILYARLGTDRSLCCGCWKRAGRPFPRKKLSELELHESELAMRAKMTARGGTDRHLVRAGKT